MYLIADSGSTKTTWHLISDIPGIETDCQTTGINPFFQQSSDIVKTLEKEFTLDKSLVRTIYFYGAGVANEAKKQELTQALETFFPGCQVNAESDLMAAAHSLCAQNEGIAAILGTGSNSCYYDGANIAEHVSPLGYILGDEGSGAVLGKKLVSDIMKNQFPQHLIKLFFETYNLTPAQIMEQVYRKPYPNRFLAGFTRFLHDNLTEDAVQELVLNSFIAFFKRNISQYTRAGYLPVNFTGSIAYYFSGLLAQAAGRCGFETGKIVKDPMPGLIDYHKLMLLP